MPSERTKEGGGEREGFIGKGIWYSRESISGESKCPAYRQHIDVIIIIRASYRLNEVAIIMRHNYHARIDNYYYT
jgi:hypothetical protein